MSHVWSDEEITSFKLLLRKISEKFESEEDVKEAMDLKIKNKNLSIPNTIGYTVAKRHNVKFLTGDEGFRNMDHVEFVK